MKYEKLTIKTPQEVDKKKKIIETVFFMNHCLPQQVFAKNYDHFGFEEFEWAFSCEFWKVLQYLGKLSGDTHLTIAMLKPFPFTYFFKEFGYYNWFEVPLSMTMEEYGNLIEYGPPTNHLGALLYYSEIIVWLPRSCKWAIWGQRGYGTCILAYSDSTIIKLASSLPGMWRPAHEALNDFICLNFRNQLVPEEFAREFLANYSNTE